MTGPRSRPSRSGSGCGWTPFRRIFISKVSQGPLSSARLLMPATTAEGPGKSTPRAANAACPGCRHAAHADIGITGGTRHVRFPVCPTRSLAELFSCRSRAKLRLSVANAAVRNDRNCPLVQRPSDQVGEKGPEAADRQPGRGSTSCQPLLGRSSRPLPVPPASSFAPWRFMVIVLEQQRRQAPRQVVDG